MWVVQAADAGDHISTECWTLAPKIPSESLDSDLGVDFCLWSGPLKPCPSPRSKDFAQPPLPRTIFPNKNMFIYREPMRTVGNNDSGDFACRSHDIGNPKSQFRIPLLSAF